MHTNSKMQEYLITLANQHTYFVYIVIILLACAEGPILSMIGGALIKFGYFSFWPIYLALMFGDLLGDSIWYWVGYKFGHRFIKRFGKYVGVTEEGVTKATALFHRYKNSILFISKISNGFGLSLITLITAGMARIPFWRYISINLAGEFIWSGMLIGVGYFFSSLYTQVNTVFERIGVAVLFVVIVWLFLQYKKYMGAKINDSKVV